MGAIVQSAATFGSYLITTGIFDVTSATNKRLCLALLCPCRNGHAHNCVLWLLVRSGVLGRSLGYALFGLDGDFLIFHLGIGLV